MNMGSAFSKHGKYQGKSKLLLLIVMRRQIKTTTTSARRRTPMSGAGAGTCAPSPPTMYARSHALACSHDLLAFDSESNRALRADCLSRPRESNSGCVSPRRECSIT